MVVEPLDISQIPKWPDLFAELESLFEARDEGVLVQLLQNINIDFNKKYYREVLIQLEDIMRWMTTVDAKHRVNLLVSITQDLKNSYDALALSNVIVGICKEESMDTATSLGLLGYFVDQMPSASEAQLQLKSEYARYLAEIDVPAANKYMTEDVSLLYESLDEMDPEINAQYWWAAANVSFMGGKYNDGYDAIRKHLLYRDLDDMDKERAVRILTVCTLLGEHIYNFREVLEQPIMQWYQFAVQEGELPDYIVNEVAVLQSIEQAEQTDELKSKIEKSESLRQHIDLLNDKLSLNRLIQYCTVEKQKRLKLAHIQEKCGLPDTTSTYEALIRAIANDLIGGSIAGVEGEFHLVTTKTSAMNAGKSMALAHTYTDMVTSLNGLQKFYSKVAEEVDLK